MPQDALPGAFTMDDMARNFDDLVVGVTKKVVTANRVYDGLRSAALDELESNEDVVYRLVEALPNVLSYRLTCVFGGHLRDDTGDDDRQPFWRRIRARCEVAYLESMLLRS